MRGAVVVTDAHGYAGQCGGQKWQDVQGAQVGVHNGVPAFFQLPAQREQIFQSMAAGRQAADAGPHLPNLGLLRKGAVPIDEKVELEHQAIFRTKTLQPYLNDESIIRVSAMPFSGYIAVGSTKHSIAKFWASAGVLEKRGDSFIDKAITPKQLADATYDWQNIDLGIKGKNFGKIRIINGAKATS